MSSESSLPVEGKTPSILGCMILIRMIANSKPPSRSQIVKDLRSLFPVSLQTSDSAWKDLIALTMRELFDLKCVTDPVKKSQVTDRGREVLRGFLKTSSLPDRKSWPSIKKLVLAPLAFGEKPASNKELDRVGKADGFHAELLRHLFNLKLNAFPSLPLAISALAAQQGVYAKKPTADSLREAFLQSWIAGIDGYQIHATRSKTGAVAESTQPDIESLPMFANRVREIADSLSHSGQSSKVLISRIWKLLKSSDDGKSLSRERFNELLLQSNQAQLLTLSRADLSTDLDPQEFRESELSPEFGDKFHFVRTHRD